MEACQQEYLPLQQSVQDCRAVHALYNMFRMRVGSLKLASRPPGVTHVDRLEISLATSTVILCRCLTQEKVALAALCQYRMPHISRQLLQHVRIC